MAYPIIGVVVFLSVAVVIAFVGDHLAKGITEFFDEFP